MKLIISRLAETDLMDGWSWIANDNPTAADRWLKAMHGSMTRLCNFPAMGKAFPDFGPNIHGLIKDGYFIFYWVDGDRLYIHRILSCERDIATILQVQ